MDIDSEFDMEYQSPNSANRDSKKNRLAYFPLADLHDHGQITNIVQHIKDITRGIPEEDESFDYIRKAVKHLESAQDNVAKAMRSLRSQFGK